MTISTRCGDTLESPMQITVRTTARGAVKPLLNSLSTLVNTQAWAEIEFSCGVALLSILCAGS